MKKVWIRGLLAWIAAFTPWAAFAAPSVSPAAGTDAVLAMRAARSSELQLEYHKDSGHDPGTVSVGIASDYHYVRMAGRTRIYDYKLRRIFTVEGENFVNDSMYAEVWYRAAELHNRIVLAGAMKGAGIQPPKETATLNDPFYMESELGVISQDVPRPELKQVTDNGRISWRLKDDEVAAVRYEKKAVPTAIQGSLRRFWPTFAPVHPDIADTLAASNRMPTELWVKEKSFAKDAGVGHWKLTQSKWEASAAYPLPAHLAAHPAIETGAFPEIFATLSAETAEKRTPPTQETYVSRTEAAINKDAGLEAVLWIIEMSLARGQPYGRCEANDTSPYCALSVRAGPLAKKDPRTLVAFTANSPAESERAQFDTLPNAYLLRLLWATRPPGKDVKPAEGENGLLAALRASPVANFCKDTGDFYAAHWQPFVAWQAWDFGRLMAGHMQGDLLDSVDTIESNLAKSEHNLF